MKFTSVKSILYIAFLFAFLPELSGCASNSSAVQQREFAHEFIPLENIDSGKQLDMVLKSVVVEGYYQKERVLGQLNIDSKNSSEDESGLKNILKEIEVIKRMRSSLEPMAGFDFFESWEQAIETAVDKRNLFSTGSARAVAIDVTVLELRQARSSFGAFPATLVAQYRLLDMTDGSVIIDTLVETTEAGEEFYFAGATRINKSIAASVRANIDEFLSKLEEQGSI